MQPGPQSPRRQAAALATASVQGSARTSLTEWRTTVLEKSFLFLRRFKPVRERVTIGEYNDHVEREHLARYRFAMNFCQGKRVADIACGTGFGTAMLATVADCVHGYDKEPLCGNRLVDLEKDAWNERYDVIVSFETIEHLANPEFFLENARHTTRTLIVSTPIGEFRGYNPYHKQVWTLPAFKKLVDGYFRCEYYVQQNERIEDCTDGPVRFAIAVGTAKSD